MHTSRTQPTAECIVHYDFHALARSTCLAPEELFNVRINGHSGSRGRQDDALLARFPKPKLADRTLHLADSVLHWLSGATNSQLVPVHRPSIRAAPTVWLQSPTIGGGGGNATLDCVTRRMMAWARRVHCCLCRERPLQCARSCKTTPKRGIGRLQLVDDKGADGHIMLLNLHPPGLHRYRVGSLAIASLSIFTVMRMAWDYGDYVRIAAG